MCYNLKKKNHIYNKNENYISDNIQSIDIRFNLDNY